MLARPGIVTSRWSSPRDIEGVRYYDASILGSMTDAGSGHISQWNDVGGQFSNHFVQATDSRRPIYNATGINGRPSLDFTKANSSRMDFGSAANDSANFFAIVFQNALQIDAAATGERILCPAVSSPSNGCISTGAITGTLTNELVTVSITASVGAVNNGYTSGSDSYALNTNHFVMGFGGADWSILLDSLVNKQNAQSTALAKGRIRIDTARVGQGTDASNGFGGKIGMIILASRAKPIDVLRTRDFIFSRYRI